MQNLSDLRSLKYYFLFTGASGILPQFISRCCKGTYGVNSRFEPCFLKLEELL
jgi:hypothetical protein